jgi:hypothetical protein
MISEAVAAYALSTAWFISAVTVIDVFLFLAIHGFLPLIFYKRSTGLQTR